jgi:hypothetical protein
VLPDADRFHGYNLHQHVSALQPAAVAAAIAKEESSSSDGGEEGSEAQPDEEEYETPATEPKRQQTDAPAEEN